MRQRHRLRRASIVAGAGAALLLAAHPAAAAPTDTVFPIPVAGLALSLGSSEPPRSGYTYVTATTDPDTPGVTRLGPDTGVHVHWRNISTGAAGVAYLGNRGGTPVETGSGTVVAVATAPQPDGIFFRILVSTPGAGVWTVP
ncbi:hypothetical protein [Rhodococcus sp. NPDC127528]|uniref:hypothetical protein n=1 Tax=unclassified Rhodococcus (in: high G+C Gram-positive bacteria) TaxID=192944 RepID=UPI00362DBA5A